MRKTFLLSLITIIAIGLMYWLILNVGMKGFLFAWTLNFLLMMCVFTFTETLKSQFTASYYGEKKWERNGKVYAALGIDFYRKLLVWTGWEKFNKKANPVEKDIKALTHLYHRTKQSELGHLIILIIVFGFTIFVAFKYGIKASISLFILNILLNLYPIFLQRYNRPRLLRAINLSKHRQEKSLNLI